jgi:hypothetical protein
MSALLPKMLPGTSKNHSQCAFLLMEREANGEKLSYLSKK